MILCNRDQPSADRHRFMATREAFTVNLKWYGPHFQRGVLDATEPLAPPLNVRVRMVKQFICKKIKL